MMNAASAGAWPAAGNRPVQAARRSAEESCTATGYPAVAIRPAISLPIAPSPKKLILSMGFVLLRRRRMRGRSDDSVEDPIVERVDDLLLVREAPRTAQRRAQAGLLQAADLVVHGQGDVKPLVIVPRQRGEIRAFEP